MIVREESKEQIGANKVLINLFLDLCIAFKRPTVMFESNPIEDEGKGFILSNKIIITTDSYKLVKNVVTMAFRGYDT